MFNFPIKNGLFVHLNGKWKCKAEIDVKHGHALSPRLDPNAAGTVWAEEFDRLWRG